jgi:hypothetical protein
MPALREGAHGVSVQPGLRRFRHGRRASCRVAVPRTGTHYARRAIAETGLRKASTSREACRRRGVAAAAGRSRTLLRRDRRMVCLRHDRASGDVRCRFTDSDQSRAVQNAATVDAQVPSVVLASVAAWRAWLGPAKPAGRQQCERGIGSHNRHWRVRRPSAADAHIRSRPR